MLNSFRTRVEWATDQFPTCSVKMPAFLLDAFER
ncbi:hypothetical protein GGR27_002311 [Lewinella antarctica]|uniref:Uncharacterized protein n=1 Tax=Neolewinella antarctica TaxID=442734 RepID=A0ABX0XC03_9BACT|nr:hypothetical protein [Neolewinella antarctica]